MSDHKFVTAGFTIAALVLLLINPVSFSQTGATGNERMWFEYPAADWNSQALHIGNGFLGGSFYGGVKEENFDITEKTMWLGGPGENPNYRYGIKPGGRDHVNTIREAIVAANVGKADRLVQAHFMGDYSNFGAFSMIGRLRLIFDDHDGAWSDYRRELDLSRSLAVVSYKMDGVQYRREYFCSYPDRIMVMRFTSDSSGKLSFILKHELTHSQNDVTFTGDELLVKGKIDGNNRAYRVRIKVLHKGGELEADGGILKLSEADSATVIYTAATEYRLDPPEYKGADPDALTSAWIKAASQTPYEQLKQRHIRDYRELYDRVELDLAGDPSSEKLPSNQRWENLRNGESNDTGLRVLLFNLGRYLLISASRPGTLPSTLQGVWNTYPRAPWRGNYQSNVNLQAMYWPSGPVNLLECQRAYVDWIKAQVIPGREVARNYYGTNGWVSHTTGNIWGYAAPGTGLIWGIYPVGATWHCQHLWEHYAFSMDKKFLEEEAYPVMKEAAEFWLANLVPFEGYLISAPTVSAEHGVQEKDGAYIDPTVKAESQPEDGSVHRYNIPGAYQDIQMIHDLFTNVLEAADILGTDRMFRDSVDKARAKLLPLKIGRLGQLQEWYQDIDSPKDHHRHIAHLWALFPGRMIHPLTTPDLAEAAKKSLNMRGDGRFEPLWVYSGGNWARTWRIWCWARLLDGDRADRIFMDMIREQGFENLMTFQHVPSENRMQVDGSMSTPGIMAEMLLQSHLGEIHLLPALPGLWSNGSVRGLIARGGYKVDMEWQKGHLTRADVKASRAGVPRIRVEGKLIDPAKDSRVTVLLATK
jgi:alpha-L-fucosidase 2